MRLTRVGQVGQLWLAPDVWSVSSVKKIYISANLTVITCTNVQLTALLWKILGSSCLAGEPQQDGCNCNGHKNPVRQPLVPQPSFQHMPRLCGRKDFQFIALHSRDSKKNRWVEVLICVCGSNLWSCFYDWLNQMLRYLVWSLCLRGIKELKAYILNFEEYRIWMRPRRILTKSLEKGAF